MDAYDIAIHGSGMLPALLAIHLSNREPHLKILFLASDKAACGDEVEPVLVDEMSTATQDLVDPFRVADWPGYFTVKAGTVERFDRTVWLLDPVQIWLELLDRADRCRVEADSGAVVHTGSRLVWRGKEALIDRFIDLSPLTAVKTESEILGIEDVRYLSLPFLADYDTVEDGWEANQLLPLGDDRVLVRKLPRRTDLVAANSTFVSILNALIDG